jgi:restriction system protein
MMKPPPTLFDDTSRSVERLRKPRIPVRSKHPKIRICSPPPSEREEENLLDVLKSLSPRGFELICERLLREHGFEEVEVTQQSRDGGIDGYGVLRLSPFVSLKVAFQAKKYKEVVSRSTVGEFRNAFLGRAEKGVFITTGRFTADAEAEATRDGVPPIELIDGERLVELFEEAKLGVKLKQIFEIDYAFFDQFRSVKE